MSFFFYGRNNTLKYRQGNVTIPSCRRRLVAFHRLAYHLQVTHKMSNSLAQKLFDDFKRNRTKNDIGLVPLIPST